jgi:ankyrin repeat protein
MLDLLLEKGADPKTRDNQGWNALHMAANFGHTNILQLLFLKEIDWDLEARDSDVYITEDVAQAAAENGNSRKDMMTLLPRERGSKVEITDEVVKQAAKNGQEQVLHLLKRHFAIDISGWIPIAQLYNASKTGDEKVVQMLLGQDLDPNSKDHHGRTPLWWSASNGHVSVAALLLERDDIRLNETDDNGWTPLHEAAGNGYKPIVKLLLRKNGVDAELLDNRGLTALSWATKNGHADIVEILNGHMESKITDGSGKSISR